MFRNYLITAWRNIIKNRTFSLINVLGLALGMAVCLLVLQYVGFQLSYDSFHSKADRIYRVGYDYIKYTLGQPEGLRKYARTGTGLIQLKEDYPEIEEIVRLIAIWNAVFTFENSQNGKIVNREFQNTFYADSTFFDVFDFRLVKGNPDEVLREKNKIIISQSSARKWFGEDDPIGKTLVLDDSQPFIIEGVLMDVPRNSHIKIEYLLSFTSYQSSKSLPLDADLIVDGTYTYFLLKDDTDTDAFLTKINAKFEEYMAHYLNLWDWKGGFFLQPLKDIQTTNELWIDIGQRQNAQKLYALGLLGTLILIMAWINYINLTTVRSVKRSKEVGIRKAAGALKYQLTLQFLVETILMSSAALLISLALVTIFQEYFSQLSGWVGSTEVWQSYSFWTVLLVSFLSGTLLAGIYPAFVLTQYRPVKALKSGYNNSLGGNHLRKILSITQYAASVSLLIGTIIIYEQITFLQNQDLGFDMEQVFVVQIPDYNKPDRNKQEAFQQRVGAISGVINYTSSHLVPGAPHTSFVHLYRKSKPKELWTNLNSVGAVDYNFLEFYGMELIDGRFFNPANPIDSNAFVLSETAVKRLGFSSNEEALGSNLMLDDGLHEDYGFPGGPIIGIIKDFHSVAPNMRDEGTYTFGNSGYCMTIGNIFKERPPRFYSLKVDMTHWQETEAQIKAAFDEVYPDELYEYFFQDELYNRQYQADIQFLNIFVFFAIQAIFIACLGLFGLAAFQVQKRSKEIGIRKVLGANIPDIWLLLAKDLLKALLIASIIGIPLINYFMKSWLEEFVYKIPLSWWMFALPVVLMILIALLTVSQHLRKAARLNPVKLLRYE
jgi:putative ABC transport system permease protein